MTPLDTLIKKLNDNNCNSKEFKELFEFIFFDEKYYEYEDHLTQELVNKPTLLSNGLIKIGKKIRFKKPIFSTIKKDLTKLTKALKNNKSLTGIELNPPLYFQNLEYQMVGSNANIYVCDLIINLLKNNKNITELSFDFTIPVANISTIFNALANNKSITSLKFNNTLILYDKNKNEKEAAKRFSRGLSLDNDLPLYKKRFFLKPFSVYEKSLESFDKFFTTNNFVLSIEFESCLLGPQGLDIICNALKNRQCLIKKLSLNYCFGFTTQRIQYFAEALKLNISLTHLEIAGNGFGNEGIEHIADALSNNPTLTYIDLRNNAGIEMAYNSLIKLFKINDKIDTSKINNNYYRFYVHSQLSNDDLEPTITDSYFKAFSEFMNFIDAKNASFNFLVGKNKRLGQDSPIYQCLKNLDKNVFRLLFSFLDPISFNVNKKNKDLIKEIEDQNNDNEFMNIPGQVQSSDKLSYNYSNNDSLLTPAFNQALQNMSLELDELMRDDELKDHKTRTFKK